jgi:AraC-like DNA-binding protein/ligand-binding sensor protein
MRKDLSDILIKQCYVGKLVYSTTQVYCLAIDLVAKKLIEIPDKHLDCCFCQVLARINHGFSSINHLYKKCELACNINNQLVYFCPYGLANIIIPVYDGEQLVAALQAGPILTRDPDALMREALGNETISKEAEEELLDNLGSYTKGDVNWLLALSELLVVLMTCKILPETVSLKFSESDISNNANCSELISSVIKYITSNYAEDVSLKDVAEHVFVHPSYLSREFNKNMHCNIPSYLAHLRVEKAKDMLVNSDMGIAEICYSVGFADQSYFSKVFKKTEGVTPGYYRSLHHRGLDKI